MTREDLFGDLFDGLSPSQAIGCEEPLGCNEPADESPSVDLPFTGAVVFDIETGPVESDVLESLFESEWDETKVRGYNLIGSEFDPATVRTGNLKDQAKIDAKIEEKRKEHEKAVAEATIGIARAREEAWLAFVERAPLSAVTGQVLAIGYTITNGTAIMSQASANDETAVLNDFWIRFLDCTANHQRMVGFNICGFDLPFLVRRSWSLGVAVPVELIHDEYRHWNRLFVDLAQVWACGNYGERIRLDRVAEFLGTARKSGDGADFHKLFNGTKEDQAAALDYLRQDLLVTAEVGRRMGVL